MYYNGVPETDYVCYTCMAVVPDLAVGCVHCHTRERKQAERLQAFLERKAGV